ncbi:MAG: lipopolysaccharide kinase InaA family protein, partial [Nitrospirota bacterium]|nr:lipopolysaccharide kinase InaA family protein [Nitrospirota bacterium]
MNAVRYDHNGFNGWIAPGYDSPEMIGFLADLPPRLQAPADSSVRQVKASKDRRVFIVSTRIGGEERWFHVKYDSFPLLKNLKAIKYAFLASRGQRAWKAGIASCEHSIPTPAPLALLEKRVGPFLTEALFITEYAEGLEGFMSYYREHFYRKNDRESVLEKRWLTEDLAEIVARMHKAGICHGDLKKNNIAIMPPTDGDAGFMVLDLENAEVRNNLSTPERIEDLGCLAYSLVRYTSAADRIRFFRKYCDLEQIPPKTGKRLVKEID